MFDIKWIRENPQAFDEGLSKRGIPARAQSLIELDEVRRMHITEVQEAQTRRNAASKEIGAAMAKGDRASAEALKGEVAVLKDTMGAMEAAEREAEAELHAALAAIPNLPLGEVPFGTDETGNVELRRVGEPRAFPFKPREHFEIGEALGLMDFEAAARLSGARFTVLKGGLARMERALAQFMLDVHTQENGYTEVSPPLLVRDHAMFGTNQLPKFENDQFWALHTEGLFDAGPDIGANFRQNRYGLIPTAEVPLTNLVRDQIVEASALPMRMTAGTPCFRAEADLPAATPAA